MKSLILILSLVLCSPSWAAITVVNTIFDNSDANGDMTITGTTAGNGLILFINTSAERTLTMSGETLIRVGSTFSGTTQCCGTYFLDIWYVKSLATGGSKVFHNVSSNPYYLATILEVTGQDTTDFLDSTATCTASGSTSTLTCDLTTTAANDMIVGHGMGHDSATTPGSGYTETSTGNERMHEYKLDVGAATTYTVSSTTGSAGAWIFRAAAFKAAAGGAARVRRRVIQQ